VPGLVGGGSEAWSQFNQQQKSLVLKNSNKVLKGMVSL